MGSPKPPRAINPRTLIQRNATTAEALGAACADRIGCNLCGLWQTCVSPYLRPFVPRGWTGEYLGVGEAPGADEDERTHRPFTGRAGQLLRRTLREAGIADNQIAFVNALRCRPPENRTPSLVELRACRPFLAEVIAKLAPRFVVAFGGSALAALRNTNDRNITKARGRRVSVAGLPEVVAWATYHPSSVLHGNTHHLAKIREDLGRRWDVGLATPVIAVPPGSTVAIDTEYSPSGDLLTVSAADGLAAVAWETTDLHWGANIQAVVIDARWLVNHSVAGDVHKLVENGIAVPDSWVDGSKTLDSLLLARMVDENRGDFELEGLMLGEFPVEPWKYRTTMHSPTDATLWPVEERIERCRLDAWASFKLAQYYAPLVEPKLREYTHRTAAAIERVCAAGMVIDAERFDALGAATAAEHRKYADLVGRAAGVAGMAVFSPTNDNHIRELLYERLGLTTDRTTEKSGLPSVDKITLRQLGHEAARLLLEFGHWDKALTSGWQGKPGGKSHPVASLIHRFGRLPGGAPGAYLPLNINPLGAKTGRRSSNDPNCQNWTKDFRAIVTSRFAGGLIGDHDYKRLEVVLFAYVAGDADLLDLFIHGDGYGAVAKWLWNSDVVKGTQEYRTTKSIILGIIYNMGAFKMAEELWFKDNVRLAPNFRAHARVVAKLRDKFLGRFAGVPRYITAREAELVTTGQVRSLLGRIRHLPCPDGRETPGFPRLLNQAVNFPIQSLASDVTASAILDVEAELLAANNISLSEYLRELLRTRKLYLTGGPADGIIYPTYEISAIINEVHDDVVVDFHPSNLRRDQELVIETMKAVRSLRKLVTLDVPLGVDATISTHWGAK